ncbi:MAG: hypothetical protein UX29_C0009G0036 [Parcubacteria group bacterium GW2011_GWA2_46_10]|nr:MAG: hypothetical protein UW86_C0008G0016 [Microgenomates group bacterium GW2011_GWA1_Microgenomates_45_10]KKU19152.1 MAG: hypothetical protein UX29_C0009G0036 [Parcubacteria group bacterium GW2011_GWA2_46_10]
MAKRVISVKVNKDISSEPQLKPKVLKQLKRASADYKAGRNVSGSFSSIEDLAKHLGI